LTVFFWIMTFSVNDEIFYDQAVTKQPIIFKIPRNSSRMSEIALQILEGLNA
jgi:hypothetical protein